MTAATLRNKLRDDNAEVRRGAVLACARKDDDAHVPDLLERLDDPDSAVARMARRALGMLTGKDFPTAKEWQAWWEKETGG
jgi:HEAT repeat protein